MLRKMMIHSCITHTPPHFKSHSANLYKTMVHCIFPQSVLYLAKPKTDNTNFKSLPKLFLSAVLASCAIQSKQDTNASHCEASSDEDLHTRAHIGKIKLQREEKSTGTTAYYDLLREHRDFIRLLNSPTARFHAFASQQTRPPTLTPTNDIVPAMTFTDFIHSFILSRYHYQHPRPNQRYTCSFIGNDDELITLEEYLSVLQLLQIPKIHLNVAFAIFDTNGDGNLSQQEFYKVMTQFLHTNSQILTFDIQKVFPRLTANLFTDSNKKITSQTFADMLDNIQTQLLRAEFDLYADPTDRISCYDFAITLIAGCDVDHIAPYLSRAELLRTSSKAITWKEFHDFHFHVQSHLNDIKLALELTGKTEITEEDWIRAISTVCHISLTNELVHPIFSVFDTNGNGTLDQSELMRVLEMRDITHFCKAGSLSRIARFMKCTTQK